MASPRDVDSVLGPRALESEEEGVREGCVELHAFMCGGAPQRGGSLERGMGGCVWQGSGKGGTGAAVGEDSRDGKMTGASSHSHTVPQAWTRVRHEVPGGQNLRRRCSPLCSSGLSLVQGAGWVLCQGDTGFGPWLTILQQTHDTDRRWSDDVQRTGSRAQPLFTLTWLCPVREGEVGE